MQPFSLAEHFVPSLTRPDTPEHQQGALGGEHQQAPATDTGEAAGFVQDRRHWRTSTGSPAGASWNQSFPSGLSTLSPILCINNFNRLLQRPFSAKTCFKHQLASDSPVDSRVGRSVQVPVLQSPAPPAQQVAGHVARALPTFTPNW